MSKSKCRELGLNGEESEKALERYLCRLVLGAGGLCLKYSSGTATGYPDRVVVMPSGRVCWVEVKSRGCCPSALQAVRMHELRERHQMVRLCDSREKAEAILRELAEPGNFRGFSGVSGASGDTCDKTFSASGEEVDP